MKSEKNKEQPLQKPRGTLSEFGGRAHLLDLTIREVIAVISLYGVSPIFIPVFEYERAFRHSIGTDSDIVNKELYTFKDRKNRQLALRPEGTVGVMRTIIENNLIQKHIPTPLKFYYCGPMFRYERPQNQRRREFIQVGVEYISENSELALLELLQITSQIIETMNLTQHVDLYVNTIGTIEERAKFSVLVRDYFAEFVSDLCSDCRLRFHKNVFRIADCKKENPEIIAEMPSLYDVLSTTERKKLDNLIEQAKILNIPLKYNKRVVRGLDYYDGVVFEIVNQKNGLTVIAGGSYNQLATKLGSNISTNACGFAIGIERLADLWWTNNSTLEHFKNPDNFKKFFIFSASEGQDIFTASLGKILREVGLFVTSNHHNRVNFTLLYESLKKRGYIAIIKFDDSSVFYDKNGILAIVKVYNLLNGDKKLVPVQDLLAHIQTFLK